MACILGRQKIAPGCIKKFTEDLNFLERCNRKIVDLLQPIASNFLKTKVVETLRNRSAKRNSVARIP